MFRFQILSRPTFGGLTDSENRRRMGEFPPGRLLLAGARGNPFEFIRTPDEPTGWFLRFGSVYELASSPLAGVVDGQNLGGQNMQEGLRIA